MPWVVLATERAWAQGGRYIIIAAFVAALQLLAGVPEIALLTWIVAGALWTAALITERTGRIIIARRFFLIILLAAGLIAAQLLPFVDLLLHSQLDRTFSVAKWAMPSWGWGNFVVPLFHCFQSAQGPCFQYGQEFFGSYYLGVAMLALAGWGIWKAHQRTVWLLGGLSLIAVLLALGENGVLFPLIKRVFPLAGIARYP